MDNGLFSAEEQEAVRVVEETQEAERTTNPIPG